ncbi:MAG: helix-turn-helix transcriptional regulator [Oscillospiraceae bacterium]|nr:helix-turn-helix transcriptional regulator [Oscillospiraceae bacterium]
MISYAPFYRLIKNKGLSQYDLENLGVDHKLLYKLRHNMSITMNTLNRLCLLLKCSPNDIVEFIPTRKELKKIEDKKMPSRRTGKIKQIPD